MKKTQILIFLLIFVLISCEKQNDSLNDKEAEFVPTDLFVKTKGYFTIDKVFDFINSYPHEVEYIKYGEYNSDLPSDSLQYILDYLNAKPYTHDGDLWYCTGYIHNETGKITLFPKFFQIKNTTYQADWLQTMQTLRLTEITDNENNGYIIFFHVPEGKEKVWESDFEKLDFVEWADLNHIIELNPWP